MVIYLSIRTFAIWILPHVVASWSGVEYLGKSIWLTSSPRLSLSKTSSRFPAIAASFRFFDIFLFFFRELVSCFKLRRFYYYKSDSILQLSVRPLIVFPELPWLLSLLVSLKLIQSVRRKLTHTFWKRATKVAQWNDIVSEGVILIFMHRHFDEIFLPRFVCLQDVNFKGN